MASELAEINEKLKGMVADQEAKVRFVVQTGWDEGGIVGTTGGYLRFAHTLIEFLLQAEAQETEIRDIYGHPLQGSTTIYRLFAGFDEVQLNSMILARTQEEVNEVAEAYRNGSPPG